MGTWRLIGRGILVVLGLLLVYQLWLFAHVVAYRWINPSNTAFMSAQLDRLQESKPDAELKFEWVDADQISTNLKRAVIASEDAKFAWHGGFDWDGIEAAFESNLEKGRIVAGGSTISQQLAKNLFLSGSRNPLRKVQEAVITVMIEGVLPKERILEIYLNVIEWGEGVFGAEAAARHYYGKSVRSLSRQQAARLAAMIPNPRYYDDNPNARRLSRKTGIVLRRMGSAQLP
ncbi:monofunctional biosynthetic peptidoglycan transglycosylase [Chitinibacteraceae bacterium HSL-7]